MARLALFLALATLALLQTTVLAGEEIMPVVKQLCGRTDNPDFCVAAYEQQMTPHPINATWGLPKLSMRIAAWNATRTLRRIQQSISSEPDKTILQRLEGCRKYYVVAKRNLRSAGSSFLRKQYTDMKNYEKEAMKEETGCNDIFKGAVQSHPVGTMAAHCYTLTSMSVIVAENAGF